MTQAIGDLEDVRRGLDISRWVALGRSWGCDLAVRYALDHPPAVSAVVGVAGHGLHRDRSWSEAYRCGLQNQPDPVDVPLSPTSMQLCGRPQRMDP